MYDDDLTTLTPDLEFADPLDALGPVEEEQTPAYDPEVMLPLLTASDPQQRMLAARAFCEVEDGRAVAPLIELLSDPC
ncbi:MAG: HEAT repeat domain-containing protein, partial [Nodosilinea sp.]